MSNRRGVVFALSVGRSVGLCVAVSLGATSAVGCSGRGSKQVPSSSDGATAGASGEAAETGETSPMKNIQKLVAKEFKLSPGDIEVRELAEAKAPGLVVFTAVPDAGKLGREAFRNGVYDGAQLLSERAAMTAVARAWGYGAKRTVSAVDVARTFSALHSESAAVSSILDADELDVWKSIASPKQAAASILPTEETVEGQPAVKYCIRSSSRSIPFTVVTALFKSDGVELRTEAVLND